MDRCGNPPKLEARQRARLGLNEPTRSLLMEDRTGIVTARRDRLDRAKLVLVDLQVAAKGGVEKLRVHRAQDDPGSDVGLPTLWGKEEGIEDEPIPPHLREVHKRYFGEVQKRIDEKMDSASKVEPQGESSTSEPSSAAGDTSTSNSKD